MARTGRPFNDLSGKEFGNWTVLEPVKINQRYHWKCKCVCGTERVINGTSLTRANKNIGCGCLAAKSLVGQRFDRLVVLERAKERRTPSGTPKIYWVCKCDCGTIKEVAGLKLKSGNTRSCGCYNKETRKTAAKKHGLSDHRIYWIHSGMKDRCNNPNNSSFKDYGGRGIKVCDEWQNDFMSFYNWSMKNGYSEELSIDRIDVNGNYEPSNCRWSTFEEQGFNKRNNHLITINGVTKPLGMWAKESGLNEGIIRGRIKMNWDEKDLLNPPTEEIKYKVEIDGIQKTLIEVSNEYGVNYATVLRRYHEGIRGKELLVEPFSSTKLMIEIDGETKSLEEWSKISGINKMTLHSRYHRQGWRGKKLLSDVDKTKRRKNRKDDSEQLGLPL